MPKIKKEELERVYNSLYKPKERVLPANQKKPKKVADNFYQDLSKPTVYLIDGYNLMYVYNSGKEIADNDLISAREAIINIVCDYQGYADAECVLVFDAYKRRMASSSISKQYNITVVYTSVEQSADMFIEQKSQELSDSYKVIVVTSDNLEQLRVFSNNCLRLSCREFLHRYENFRQKSPENNKRAKHQPLKELRKLLFED